MRNRFLSLLGVIGVLAIMVAILPHVPTVEAIGHKDSLTRPADLEAGGKEPTGTGVIAGLLWDVHKSKRLGGITYSLNGWEENNLVVYRRGQTAADGTFREENLPPGNWYSVAFATTDYLHAIRIDHSGGDLEILPSITSETENVTYYMIVVPLQLRNDQALNIWLGLYDHPWEVPPKR